MWGSNGDYRIGASGEEFNRIASSYFPRVLQETKESLLGLHFHLSQENLRPGFVSPEAHTAFLHRCAGDRQRPCRVTRSQFGRRRVECPGSGLPLHSNRFHF